MAKNLVRQRYKLKQKDRQKANNHRSLLIFFTGLSGAGKSTIANALEQELFRNGIATYVLDGDNIRRGINRDLGFSPEDRSENVRRVGEIANLFIDAGIVVLAAFIAPYKADREYIRQIVGPENYFEAYVNTSLKVCEQRDVKGLYKKARAGKITDMTGISAPYEIPEHPDITITENTPLDESVSQLYAILKKRLILNSNE